MEGGALVWTGTLDPDGAAVTLSDFGTDEEAKPETAGLALSSVLAARKRLEQTGVASRSRRISHTNRRYGTTGGRAARISAGIADGQADPLIAIRKMDPGCA